MAEEPPIPKYPPNLRAAGKALWDCIHRSADFSGSPETVGVIEQVCYLKDEIQRLRRIVRIAGADTRVAGSNGQPVSMPEIADLHRAQQLYLSHLKSIRVDPDEGDRPTRSQVGSLGADARWSR